MLTVLHLDDDIFDLEQVKTTLQLGVEGIAFAPTSTDSVDEFKALVLKHPFDVVILDAFLHDDSREAEGVALIAYVRENSPGSAIIMRSSSDHGRLVSRAMRSGADDFLSKKVAGGELCLRIYYATKLGNMHKAPQANARQGAIVGSTLNQIAGRMQRVVQSHINCVLVTGESGTGKEVVADLIHSHLPTNVPFVRINCGAISPQLLESELFGHVKGSFTGAIADRAGLFEGANGGWVFLDEVTSLSRPAQAALLRVIENGEIMRVGSSMVRRIQVRIVAATNEPIPNLVQQDKFRQDLWQRLQEVEIPLPPLRERRSEIQPLAEHFAKSMGSGYKISGPAMAILQEAAWKNGNVRELRNCLRAMTEFAVNGELTPMSIPERILQELDDTTDDTGVEVTMDANSTAKVILELPSLDPMNFQNLCDRLLLQLTRMATRDTGKVSLRALAKSLDIPRTTLSTYFKALIRKGAISSAELSRMVSIRSE